MKGPKLTFTEKLTSLNGAVAELSVSAEKIRELERAVDDEKYVNRKLRNRVAKMSIDAREELERSGFTPRKSFSYHLGHALWSYI